MPRKAPSRKVHHKHSKTVGGWFYSDNHQEARERIKAGISAGWERTEELRKKFLKDNAAA